jgi:hypothetical protein
MVQVSECGPVLEGCQDDLLEHVVGRVRVADHRHGGSGDPQPFAQQDLHDRIGRRRHPETLVIPYTNKAPGT